jgi:hypothetical protein
VSAERLQSARAFAAFAMNGWTQPALRAFCTEHGISEDQSRIWWPRGLRSVAWDLNAAADEEMMMHWPDGASSLAAVFEQRFKSNGSLRRSVGHLAKSDLFHPFNTIARTAETARCMLTLRDLRPTAWNVSRVVVAYSAAVLIWVGDRGDGSRTARAGSFYLALVGLR